MTRASILVPTFRAEFTLAIAVQSALRQTVTDVEVIIIGDGVDEGTRTVALDLVTSDDRVRFLDFVKGENRGELHRDTGVREAQSNAIFYLADDDILLPNHVENLLYLLSDHVFVQSRNAYFDRKERLTLLPADLSDAECIAWHLEDPPRNGVSTTGTAHSREFYLSLDRGWSVTPPGIWTDLFMWRAFFARPDFSGATHTEVTTLQFPASIHTDRGANGYGEMMQRWEAFSRLPDACERMAEILDEAERRTLVSLTMLSHKREVGAEHGQAN